MNKVARLARRVRMNSYLLAFILIFLFVGFLLYTEKAKADPLEGKTPLGEAVCVIGGINNNRYAIPCKAYEDSTHYYYSLARPSGEVVIIKRALKDSPFIEENWWVAPELQEALDRYERVHSF